MSEAARSRTSSLKVRAATWENATFTAGHASYRAHLENLRMLLQNIEFVIARDSDEAARWFRQHGKKTKRSDDKPRVCPRLPWLTAYLDSVRYRWKGKLAAELVQEAAKDAVRMAGVHAEYLLMEGIGQVASDRYRREEK